MAVSASRAAKTALVIPIAKRGGPRRDPVDEIDGRARDPGALEGSPLDRRYHVDTRIATTRRYVLYQGLDLVAQHAVTLAVARSGEDAEALLRATDRVRGCLDRHLVGVLDIAQTRDEIAFVVLQEHHGTSLADALADWKPQAWPWKRVAAIGRQLCSALRAYHGCGIGHGDVSPHSCTIAWDESGDPTVRLLAIGGSGGDQGRILGGAELRQRARADIEGVGAVLYAVLTGRAPTSGDEGIVLPSTLRPGLPKTARQLERVIVRALSDDPYSSAARMYDALRRAENVSNEGADRPIEAVGVLEVCTDDRAPEPRTRPTSAWHHLRVVAPLLVALATGGALWLLTNPRVAGHRSVTDRTLAHAVVTAPASPTPIEAVTPRRTAPSASARLNLISDSEEPAPRVAASNADAPRARPAPPPPPSVTDRRAYTHPNQRGVVEPASSQSARSQAKQPVQAQAEPDQDANRSAVDEDAASRDVEDAENAEKPLEKRDEPDPSTEIEDTNVGPRQRTDVSKPAGGSKSAGSSRAERGAD